MRNAAILSALCGFAAAAPQMINIEAALAMPTPSVLGPKPEETKPAAVTYNPAAAASAAAEVVTQEGLEVKLKRRNSFCGPLQPGGAGPVPKSGSVAEYLAEDSELRQNARKAVAPKGYTESFKDLKGSTQQIGYLTYKNIESGEYDVDSCAKFCDDEKFCLGFNIFYERDPSSDPNPNCQDPAPITNVKCSIYGYPVAAASATNEGQWREKFNVVITGSNGYSKATTQTCKDAPAAANFEAPKNLKAAINAPLLPNGYDTYNGMRLFNENPYDPTLCAAACEAQGKWDSEHHKEDGTYKPCNFFTSYILTKNGAPLGTYCALYTDSWDDDKYAVNTGYYYGDDVYSVVCAAAYTASNPDIGGGRGPQPEVKEIKQVEESQDEVKEIKNEEPLDEIKEIKNEEIIEPLKF